MGFMIVDKLVTCIYTAIPSKNSQLSNVLIVVLWGHPLSDTQRSFCDGVVSKIEL